MTLSNNRICEIWLDPPAGRHNVHAERERRSAISDLIAMNYFELVGRDSMGPYHLTLSLNFGRLAFHISDTQGTPVITHVISVRPLHRMIKDYWMICDAHIRASLKPNTIQLEAIDIGRRAFHNEGSQALRDRLSSKIAIDLDTARGLFTLLSVLLYSGAATV